MRVLVTGARGFVGRRLVPRLEAAGHSVSACDSELDVADPGGLARHWRHFAPEAVVHLAALSSVASSYDDAEAVYRVNYLGSRSVLEATRQEAPGARVLLVSSAEVYGPALPSAAPFDETAPLRPRSPYARAKAAADLLGGELARQGLDVVRVRPFPHTGPGQDDRFAASSFARQIAEIEAGRLDPPLWVGSLDAVRDYLDVDDVVDAYLRILEHPSPHPVYNVASGRGLRLASLLDELLSHARVRPEVCVDPARVRPPDALVGNAQRLRASTGWAPQIPLSVTLERLLNDWRARIKVT